jgi:hypothetical protein
VLPPGIEPGSTVLQTAAMTTSAKVAINKSTMSKKLQHLNDEALWIVMHPLIYFDSELHEIYPWMKAETIRWSNKISYYLEPIKHKVMVAPLTPVRFFSKYQNILTFDELKNYTDQHNITELVYCGFHHGGCILSEKHVGMEAMSRYYKCYLKHDLTTIAGTLVGGWDSADFHTKEFGTII